MSVAASVATKRSIVPNVLARLFGPAKQRRTIARQIGKTDARHRFGRTAAVGDRRTGVYECGEEHGHCKSSALFSLGLRIDTLDWQISILCVAIQVKSQHRYPVHPSATGVAILGPSL